MATTTNFGWETPDDTDLVKDGAAAIRTALGGVDTSFVDLKGGTTGQVLSKASNTDLDYTWVTTDDANAIQNAIVDAKGDLIAASAADTPARLAVGNNGETLVADSSTSTGLRYQSNFSAGKNAIINGAFDIWQRGTSATANNAFAADRFFTSFDGSGTFTTSQQTFTPGTAPVAGYEGTYFQRIALNTAGSSTYYQTATRVENVRTFAGQTITLSFWAKANTSTTITNYIEQYYGTGGSATTGPASTTFAVTTSWQRFSYTVQMPSIVGKTIGAGNYVQITLRSFSIAAGASLDIWGVQFEASATATAFQTATGTIQGELAACQRYYYRTGNGSNDPLAMGAFATTTVCNGITTFPVTMRTRPTALEQSGTASDYRLLFNNGNATCSAVPTFEQASPSMARIRFDIASGGTAGGGATFASNATNGYLAWSAEL